MHSFRRMGTGEGTGRASARGGLPKAWALRSVFVNAGGSALDYTILFLLVGVANAPLAPAALLGVSAGATFNFLVNRRCVFGNVAGGPRAVRRQAFRYAGGIASLLLVHTGAVWLLASRWALPLVAVKPTCDLLFLAVGQLLLMRYVVFASPLAMRTPARVGGVAVGDPG